MTIDEAIKHCKEEAEKYMEYGIETECYQCGKEHEQLAEWLTELKEARAELDRLYPILENARILAKEVIELKEKLFDKHLNK